MPAGRPIGMPNKPTQALRALLDKRFPGWNPVEQMAEIAQDETADIAIRLNAAKEVAKYVYPQLKAVELATGEEGLRITQITRQIIDARPE
jgi:hypothetical protein